MTKKGRRWSFLLASEEVQDERGLGTASSGYTGDTHTLPLQTLPRLQREAWFNAAVQALSNVSGTNMNAKIDVLAAEKTSKAPVYFQCSIRKSTTPAECYRQRGGWLWLNGVSILLCRQHM